jgi:UDP-N-acetylglucosamine--N-acetylmuramyl-(pentapeptide) pyrophosphoryl-undecaprenol N-acetylglucosamine transferase
MARRPNPPSVQSPRVLIAAGGTAGHVVPALAVADELRARGAHVEFAGGDRVEARMVPEAGYPFHRFAIGGIPRRLSPELARSLMRAGAAPLACRRIISKVRPDVVFGAGGYVSGPMLAAAAASRIPTALLEVDAHMGVANRLAAPFVRRVFLTSPIHGRSGGRYEVTGRPIPSPMAIAGTAEFDDVVVFGGSLGATTLNRAAADAWATSEHAYRVLHITGEREYPIYRDRGRPGYQVIDFHHQLWYPLARCRLVVARAGGSVFEIAAAGKPSILIPSPNVTGDHQTVNARRFVEAGAAVLLPDSELTGARLREEVERLLADESRLTAMGEAAHGLARHDAAATIAERLLEMAQ